MTVPVVLNSETNNSMREKNYSSLKEKEHQRKRSRDSKKAKRSRVCFVMHRRFL